MQVTLYHNPRCSKSRATLALLRSRGIEPEVVEYLKTPPDAATLRGIAAALAVPASELLRSGEPEYAEFGLGPHSSDADLLAAIGRAPRLLQRPIVVVDGRAVFGRPPENALALIDAEKLRAPVKTS